MPSLSPLRDTALALAVCLCPFAATAAPAAAQNPEPSFSDLVFPHESYEDVGGQMWICFRAVDVMTGAPLPNAELFLIAESNNPVRGEFAFQQRIAADADGFMRVPLGTNGEQRRRWSWLMLRAPGFGQRMEMNALEGVIELARAVDMPVQVLDPLGLPVADCLVGFCCGCGHTPDLVSARTNAGGLCTLPGIDDREGIRDIYLEHPRLGLFYNDVDWFPGEPPAVIHPRSARAAQGIVVDHDGKPVAGAFVGDKDVHRGPWTRTAADGTFLLCGIVGEPTELWVHSDGRELLIELADTAPLRLQLPPAPAPDPDRRSDFTEIVELPPGTRSREQTLAASPPWPAPGWPTVPVRLVDAPADATVELTTATRTLDVAELIQRGEPVPMPDEPFAFVLCDNRQRRTFPFTRETAKAAGVVHLRWFRPTRIEGRVVDADGKPLDARLALLPPTATTAPDLEDLEEATGSAGAIQLSTEAEGLRLLAVIGSDRDHVTRIAPVLLPPRGDDVTVDVGTIALVERPQYLLRDAAGELLVDWQVALLRRGFVACDSMRSVRMQQDGHAPLPDLQPGDVLFVSRTEEQPEVVDGRAVHTVPARFLVHGPGPWDFTVPAGQVAVNVRCDDDPDATVHLYLDDLDIPLTEPLLLRGLTPGRHRCFAGAKGHRTAIVDVDVPEQGIGSLELKLPPR